MAVKKKVIGGQAVIEGVMMKSPTHYAVAVRKPNKRISVKKDKLKKKPKILKLPFLRGIVELIEMLIIGTKALTYSANESAGDKDEKMSGWEIFLSMLFAIGLVIVLFIVAPLLLTKIFFRTGFWFDLVDGIFRIAILIGYIVLIGLLKDVKLLYRYHGAEHKTVHCYEAGKKLTPENVKKFPEIHTRCGTSFLIIVVVLSILLFTLIRDPRWYVKLGYRILLIPVVAGISYEILKFTGKYHKNPIVKIIAKPGLWVQKLTTRKPAKKQIEVAIKALNAVK